ncbi:MAG: C69 family dipeptidase [Promethearchaeati archaeon SRVP18_Atabeyarchaeia-1]
MCDTLVALRNSTEDGSVIIAKNSDRDPNECQVIRHFLGARHPSGSKVRCTYIEIPQVIETYEVVLSAPHWMWGAEMGANVHGVAIGNESVFSLEPYAKTFLLGMDLIRLALERADSSRNALDVITSLLEAHGQGGNCSATEQMYYHSSYIIADPREAWVLETADRYWVAERVQDVRSISNGYTIGSRWDLASPGLVEHAMEKGWCKSRKEFDFTRCYSDQGARSVSACVERSNRAGAMLKESKGSINSQMMMKILRDHGEKGETWAPHKGKMGNICMHAIPSVLSTSAGSYVGHLTEELPTHWLTGTSNPCISVFVPVYLGGAGPLELFSKGGGAYDDGSPWWRHERLARIIQLDYAKRAPPIQREIKELQSSFMDEAHRTRQQAIKLSKLDSAKLLRGLTWKLSRTVYDEMPKWISLALGIGDNAAAGEGCRHYWNKVNSKANLQV